ncbi:transmembrane and ubiquitin-like domain-containing protein 1 isoform X2 [Zootoca vivipara]|nr:transmembrane and ubiquitin-like domain-containing protein 1 isoform X2 [Zootoca vivipara]
MALIEGVGDEVTVLFGVLLVLLVLALAWFSTRTVERGDPLFAASPPLAAGGQPREGGLLVEGRSGAQVSGVRQVKDEGASSSAAAASDPGVLRHRTAPSPAQAPRLAPGAEAPPADNTIVLRLKFLNDTERLARVHPEDTVGTLKRTHFPGQEQLVRLIYQGQLLRDDSQTLSALHLAHNSVVHCHISQNRPLPAPTHGNGAPADAAQAALNVGSLMVPLFVLMLGALWYFQLQYRHVFTATATTCLAGLTLVFSFVAFAVYRR